MPYKSKDKQREASKQWHALKMKSDPEFAAKRRAQAQANYKRHQEAYRNRILKNYRKNNPPVIGICPICGFEGKLVWDHDHKTEKFRSYICRYCNLTLGHAKDNPSILRKCAEYLEKHGTA